MSTPAYVPVLTNPGAGRVNAPASSPAQSLEAQLKAVQGQVDSFKRQNNQMKAQLAKLGNGPADRAKRAQIMAKWKTVNDALAKANQKAASLQNKVWEATGNYEQLLKGTERDAFMAVNALFKNYGLESLAGKIYDYVKNGYSPDTISILLQDTKEYKQRFAGNEIRRNAGLPVLNPGEYLATEAAFKQIMQAAGMPKGFYDQNSDFNDWIGKNISPSEIQSRVDLAVQATVLSNPSYRKALNALGISDKDMTAYFLDSNRALPYIQKAAATAQIGAEALQQGLAFDTAYAGILATEGISAEEAAAGYTQIGQELSALQQLGGIYGGGWTQRESEEALLRGSAGALAKRQRLTGQEKGAFSGAAGAARGGLAGRGGAR